MSVSPQQRTGASRVAAVHEREDGACVVVAEPAGASARILAAEHVPPGDLAALRALLDRHRASRVLRLLPAASVVCRLREAPEASEAELADAVALLAEVELPPVVPPHRRAWGVLACGGGRRKAVLLGWPESGGDAEAIRADETWTSEIAGLLAIGRLAGAAGGARILAVRDRRAGSIGVVAWGKDVLVRTVREAGVDERVFDERLRTVLRETASRLDLTPPAEIGDVVVDDETRSWLALLPGAQAGDVWIQRYAVAAGAALGAVTAGEATRRLYELRRTAPSRRVPLPVRIAATLARPGTAAAVALLGVGVAVAAPLGFEFARAKLLEREIDEYEAMLQLGEGEDAMTIEERVLLYDALDDERWPMTKILADIAAALPAEDASSLALIETIEVEAGERFVVRGTADSLDLYVRFREALNTSAVFSDVQPNRVQTADDPSSPVEFDISGWVARPFGVAANLEDFGERNIAQRLYGDDAELVVDGPVVSAESRRDEAATAPRRGGGPAARRDGDDGDAGGERAAADRRGTFTGGSSRAEEQAPEIPPPIDDDEIAKLDNIEAMREYQKRRSAARNASGEDKTRLEAEADKLRARAREAQAERAGGGA